MKDSPVVDAPAALSTPSAQGARRPPMRRGPARGDAPAPSVVAAPAPPAPRRIARRDIALASAVAAATGIAAFLAGLGATNSPAEVAALIDAGVANIPDAVRLRLAGAASVAVASAAFYAAARRRLGSSAAAAAAAATLGLHCGTRTAGLDVRVAPWALLGAGVALATVAAPRRFVGAVAAGVAGIALVGGVDAAGFADGVRVLFGRAASAPATALLAPGVGVLLLALAPGRRRPSAVDGFGALAWVAGTLAAASASRCGSPLDADATPSLGALLAALAAASAVAAWTAGVRTRAGAITAACGLLLLWTPQATGVAARRAADDRARAEAARVVERRASLLPPRERGLDVLVGVPEAGARKIRSALRAAGYAGAFEFPDPAEPPPRLRLARFGRLLEEGFAAAAPEDVFPVLDAFVDRGLRAEHPAHGAALPCARAEDEPVFRFSAPLDRDPGVDSHQWSATLVVTAADGRVRVHTTSLDASVLERTEEDGRAVYRWKPSWRSDSHADRELRWETEDFGGPGAVVTWTPVIGRPHGDGCAAAPAPPPASRPKPAFRGTRPTTCAPWATFRLLGAAAQPPTK